MLILGVLVVAFPLYVTFVASTLTLEQIMQVPMPLMPGDQLWENYCAGADGGLDQGLEGGGRRTMLVNSLVMALVIPLGKIAISIISAFAIVYFRFPLRMFFFWMIFITLMLPVEVRIIPTFKVIADLGHAQHLRGADGAADRLGHRHVPVPPVLHDHTRRARRGRARRRRGADALLSGTSCCRCRRRRWRRCS